MDTLKKEIPDWDVVENKYNAWKPYQQYQIFAQLLTDFEYQIASIDREDPEKASLIKDWNFGQKCQAKLNAIQRSITVQNMMPTKRVRRKINPEPIVIDGRLTNDEYCFDLVYETVPDEKTTIDLHALSDLLPRLNPTVNGVYLEKYPGIADALKEYIQDVSDSDLETIINTKSLPAGGSKKMWIGNQADACRFANKTCMSFSQWNKCFLLKSKKLLHHGMIKGTKLLEKEGRCKILNILAQFGLK